MAKEGKEHDEPHGGDKCTDGLDYGGVALVRTTLHVWYQTTYSGTDSSLLVFQQKLYGN